MVVYQLDDEICFGFVLPLQVIVTTMIITCLGKKGYQPKTNSLDLPPLHLGSFCWHPKNMPQYLTLPKTNSKFPSKPAMVEMSDLKKLVRLGRPIFFQPENLVVLRKGPPLPKTQSIEVSLQDTTEVFSFFVCLKTWVLANRVGLYLFKMICGFLPW